MPTFPMFLLVLGVLAAAPPASLPRGTQAFRLGMFRAQIDSAIAARGVEVISNGTAFLVCASDDPAVEYEQYAFFMAPHGFELLWKVTVGYRLEATRADCDTVRSVLEQRLGPPASDTGALSHERPAYGTPPPISRRQVIWVDAMTAVQLGARWSEDPDQKRADRMLVTWVDRRLQRLVEARNRKEKN